MTHPYQRATLTVATDRTLIRAAAESTRYLHVRVGAPVAPAAARRPPINLALVLDRSGSMSGEKLARAVRSATAALRHLTPEDRFSIVSFHSAVRVEVPATWATPGAVAEAVSILSRMETAGSTALADGWLRGVEQVALGQELPGLELHRVLLLTDGQANVGEKHPARLAEIAAELRTRGVRTSTFGIGRGFNEELLAAMADAGGGNFHFLDTPEAEERMLAAEVGEALEVTLPQTMLTLDADVSARIEVLDRWPFRPGARWGSGSVDLGDLVSGQVVELVVALTFPRGVVGSTAGLRVGLDARGELAAESVSIAWEYQGHEVNDAQSRNRDVDRAVATRFAARARHAGFTRNREGDLHGGMQVLLDVAERVRQYAGNDAELQQVVSMLAAEARELGTRQLDEMDRKSRHRSSYNALKSRREDGLSKRE
jgi:Ca-activated chloride channel homolog